MQGREKGWKIYFCYLLRYQSHFPAGGVCRARLTLPPVSVLLALRVRLKLAFHPECPWVLRHLTEGGSHLFLRVSKGTPGKKVERLARAVLRECDKKWERIS